MARVFEGAYAERWVLTGLYAVLPDTLGCCHIENGCSTFFLTNPALAAILDRCNAVPCDISST